MGLRIFQVDAFTDVPYAGNPAAVCPMPGPADERWMQLVAREMNLSETAFLYPKDDGFNLRWFTPTLEVDLCGHATLASAHVLWEEGYLERGQRARFLTRSGLITAEAKGKWIDMDFPSELEQRAPPPPNLAKALGVTPTYVGRNRLDYLVEVESEEIVRRLLPDFRLLRTIPGRGVMVTARASSSGYDFVSRYFAPQFGIDEDPVTGSAHCCLGPFWGERLGKAEMTGYQASARGGVVRVRLAGERVILAGQAVTVLRGELVQ